MRPTPHPHLLHCFAYKLAFAQQPPNLHHGLAQDVIDHDLRTIDDFFVHNSRYGADFFILKEKFSGWSLKLIIRR